MGKKLVVEIPITEDHEYGNTYYDLDFSAMSARTDLPSSEREGIIETLAQSDYIYTELGRDLLTAFLRAPAGNEDREL